MKIAREGLRIEVDEIFFEGTSLRDDVAFRVENDARSIEQQAVIAPDLIDHGDWNFVLTSDRRQHVAAQFTLTNPEWRCGDVEHEVAARANERLDRIDRVKALGPEQLVVPGIFADGKRNLIAAEWKQALTFRGSEVTHLVENVVSGQQHLGLQEGDSAILQKRSGIHDCPAGFGFRGSDQPTNHGDAAGGGGDLFGSLAVPSNKGWTLDQIARRIAADR